MVHHQKSACVLRVTILFASMLLLTDSTFVSLQTAILIAELAYIRWYLHSRALLMAVVRNQWLQFFQGLG